MGIAGALTLPLASVALPFDLDVLPTRVLHVSAGVESGRMQKAQVLVVSSAVGVLVLVLAALTPARPQAQPLSG